MRKSVQALTMRPIQGGLRLNQAQLCDWCARDYRQYQCNVERTVLGNIKRIFRRDAQTSKWSYQEKSAHLNQV